MHPFQARNLYGFPNCVLELKLSEQYFIYKQGPYLKYKCAQRYGRSSLTLSGLCRGGFPSPHGPHGGRCHEDPARGLGVPAGNAIPGHSCGQNYRPVWGHGAGRSPAAMRKSQARSPSNKRASQPGAMRRLWAETLSLLGGGKLSKTTCLRSFSESTAESGPESGSSVSQDGMSLSSAALRLASTQGHHFPATFPLLSNLGLVGYVPRIIRAFSHRRRC